ncbi:MAG TPA: carboxypeptidase regulatory-like domain-containing protein [Candidatus Krumholzibacteria bacterium]|nr:carboxypeptidase regulatory-like domain-containing protein [Candidatus Krumholzibacteria bacterium]
MRSFFRFVILGLVACALVAGCDDNETITVMPDTPAATGAVLGHVRDNLDGLPIAGATITTDPPTKTVQSDANGIFRINNAPVAAYILTITHTEFQTVTLALGVEDGRVSQVSAYMRSSSPDTLTVLASVSTGGGTTGVAARGYTVFAAGTAGLQVFDLTNPTNPVLLGAEPMASSYIGDVEVHGDAAYVCNNLSTFEVVDISNLNQPVRKTPFPIGGKSHDTELDGDLLVVAGDDSLIVVDVSQPLAPVRLGAVATAQDGLGQGNYGVGLDTTRKIAVLASFNNGIEIVDYSDPTAPKRIGSLGSNLNPWDCVVDPDLKRATVAGDDGIEFIDITQPSNPQRITQWVQAGNGGRDVEVVGSLAIFATTFNGLRVLDISNLSSIRTRQVLHGNIGSPANITVEAGRVYVASGDKLLVLAMLAGVGPPVAR